MNRQRLIFYFGMLLLVAACSELPKTNTITVSGLVFYNNTATPVHNAKLSVSKTRGLVACGFILAWKECSTTFPVRQYQGNPIIVSWEQAGHTWSSGEYYVQLPADPPTNTPSIAMVTLGDDGAVKVILIPHPATRATLLEPEPEIQ